MFDKIATELCDFQTIVDLTAKVLEDLASENDTVFNVRLLLSKYAVRMDQLVHLLGIS